MSASYLGVQSAALLDKYVIGAQKCDEQDNKIGSNIMLIIPGKLIMLMNIYK